MSETLRVDTLAVPTRGRVETVRACLEAHLLNTQAYGRRVRVLVFDDTRDAAEAAGLEAAVAELGRRLGAAIEVVDRRARERLAEALGGSELVRDALLTEGSVGAVRNSMLLWLVGRPFVSFDDDAFVPLGRMPVARAGLGLDANRDPTVFHFFPDRSAALRAAAPDPVDVIGVHESLLGRSVSSCIEEAEGVETPDDLARWQAAAGRVRLTMLGVSGDSGMGSTLYYFLLRGASRERLVGGDYATLRLSREVVRGVEVPTVSGSSFFMTMHAGFDNRCLLAPFPPVGRGDEHPFVLAVRRSAPDDFVGHLPWLVRHEPPVARTSGLGAVIEAAAKPQTTALIAMCVCAFRPAPGGLDRLGGWLSELGAAPPGRFDAFLRHEATRHQQLRISRLEHVLDDAGRSPPGWAEDVGRCLEAARASLRDPAFPVAIDAAGPDARRRLQQRVGDYGELMVQWPDLRDRATRLLTG
jgi:hypothetical protein